MLVPGGVQLLIISMCFAGLRVMSINSVLTACAHVNCHINTLSFSSLIYACLYRATQLFMQ